VGAIGALACWWAAGWLTTPIPHPAISAAQRIPSWREPMPELAVVTIAARVSDRRSWTLWRTEDDPGSTQNRFGGPR
jgi:hypothetical protein